MRIFKGLAGAMLLTLAVTGSGLAKVKHPTLRQQAEHDCYNDAVTLCKDDVPDEVKVQACMMAKRAQLSPACAKIFDKGLKTN